MDRLQIPYPPVGLHVSEEQSIPKLWDEFLSKDLEDVRDQKGMGNPAGSRPGFFPLDVAKLKVRRVITSFS